MRELHRENPLHRIQRWTGQHYRHASLWEVGTYILVCHHTGNSLCNALNVQQHFLEQFEKRKDKDKQEGLSEMAQWSASASNAEHERPSSWQPRSDMDRHPDILDHESNAGPGSGNKNDDIAFLDYLDRLRNNMSKPGSDEDDQGFDGVDDELVDDADADLADFAAYLPVNDGSSTDIGGAERQGIAGDNELISSDRHQNEFFGSQAKTMPSMDAFTNSYVRVIHTNGIHHVALVSCQCQGDDMLPHGPHCLSTNASELCAHTDYFYDASPGCLPTLQFGIESVSIPIL